MMDSKWWCAILPCDYELADPPFGLLCSRCGHKVDAREQRRKEWTLEDENDRRVSWYNSREDETVEVWWQDGAGEHSGWRFDVRRDGTEERPHTQGTNGFVRYRDAFILADLYMSEGRQIGALSEEQWLNEARDEYEFTVADPADFTPGRPRCPTPAEHR